MNIKVKTMSILIVTLVIGMVLGALIHGAVMQNRLKQTAFRMRTPMGFIQRMERVIQPDDSQRAEMRKILQKHFQKIDRYQAEIAGKMDSLRIELETILTEKQKERLRQGPFHPGGPRFRPPFGKERPGRRNRPFGRPDTTRHPAGRQVPG